MNGYGKETPEIRAINDQHMLNFIIFLAELTGGVISNSLVQNLSLTECNGIRTEMEKSRNENYGIDHTTLQFEIPC